MSCVTANGVSPLCLYTNPAPIPLSSGSSIYLVTYNNIPCFLILLLFIPNPQVAEDLIALGDFDIQEYRVIKGDK